MIAFSAGLGGGRPGEVVRERVQVALAGAAGLELLADAPVDAGAARGADIPSYSVSRISAWENA